jgi:hypothetical protein
MNEMPSANIHACERRIFRHVRTHLDAQEGAGGACSKTAIDSVSTATAFRIEWRILLLRP